MVGVEVSSALLPLPQIPSNRLPLTSTLSRPSSLKRSRDASRSSSPPADENQPPPPKRGKVTFGPAVVVRYSPTLQTSTTMTNAVSNPPERSLESIRLEVSSAIRKRGQGDDEEFDLLCKSICFSDDGIEADFLIRKYLTALGDVVPSLNGKCSPIVNSILAISWLGRTESFIAQYVHFLGSLLSAQVGYSRSVLRMLLGYFRSLPSSTGALKGYPVVRRPELRARMHNTMKHILRIIPAASIVLSSILESCYPRNPDPVKCYTDYASNLLKLTSYAPELKNEIMVLLLGQVVKIDVHIQVNMDDLEDDLAEALIDGIRSTVSSADQDEADLSGDELDDSDSDSDSDEEETENTARLRRLKGEVERMDSVLDVLFAHYESIFTNGTAVEKNDAFDGLLNQFCLTLLPSYRSRHTQFLLFHYSQTLPELVDKFAGTCINNMFDKTKPTLLQLSASSYLSSFISRGARIESATIGEVVTLLLEQIDDFRVRHESKCRGPDARRYSGYYCMMQSLLYIFCFRWRDLMTDKDIDTTFWDYYDAGTDFPWLSGLRDLIMVNVFSPLNPLKVCNQTIVNQFAKVASHLRFVYVHSLLDANRRIKLAQTGSLAPLSRADQTSQMHDRAGYQQRQTALSGQTDDSAFQLDAYFPFDPYRLPKSRRWLAGDYVEWKGVPGLDEEDDDDDDDDGDDDGDDGDDDEDEDEEDPGEDS